VNKIWQFLIEIITPLWELHAIWNQGSGDFLVLTPTEAGTQFSDPGEMQG